MDEKGEGILGVKSAYGCSVTRGNTLGRIRPARFSASIESEQGLHRFLYFLNLGSISWNLRRTVFLLIDEASSNSDH